MRSFHVGISWSTGGAGGSGRVIETLADHLPEQGVSVEGAVMAPADVSSRTDGRFRLLAPAGSGGIKRLLSTRSILRDSLAQIRPDVFASHFALNTFPVLDLLNKQPFVLHFHGPWAEESRVQGGDGAQKVKAKRLLERTVYRRADRAITLSQAFAKILTEVYGIPTSRIRVVPGAVDLQRFHLPQSKHAARQTLGWPTDRPILVCVRRLVPRMGLENLIRAIALLRQQHPDVLLYIAGKGALAASLQALIDDLSVAQNVSLLGFVPEDMLVSMYQAADLNVVPTLALEGFGLVVAEALAAGTPALVTPVGGLPEIVGGLSPDLIARSPSPEDLAASLRAILSGSITPPSAQLCRAYAEEHFSASRMAKGIADVYREVV